MRRRSRCAGAFRDWPGAFRVIGKVIRGTNARRLLYYLYGPGKANEHTDPHLVAGFGDPAELEPERRPNESRDLRRLAGLLDQPLAALDGDNYAQPVWHCAVRAAPQDRLLSDAEWARVAAQIMDRTGLAPEGDELAVRWVAVRHAADHIHLVATLARQHRHRPDLWNGYYKLRDACRDAERQLGLRATAPADRTAARRATRAETEQAARRGWGEAPRMRLRREVCTAAAGARTEAEFFTRLARAGVLVRERHSTVHPGELTGYAAGLPQHTTRDGQVIWYGGGKLAADLTLPKLRARWADPAARDPLAGAADLPAPAVRAVLRATVAQAAGEASSEEEFFTRLRAAGVVVRERFSDVNPGEVTGYAVTLTGHTSRDGVLRWYGGGRLHDKLALPRLRNAWARGQHPAPERSGAARFTAPERTEIYRRAACQAAAAAEHLRRCTASDPDSGADAAWAAADALHAAARATGSGVLRCAADRYDRAARTPYGRVPRRSGEGERLRAAARLLAMAGEGRDGLMGAGALAASLVALVDAVAGLRQAQAHAAQAAAARQAAQELHAAFTQARGRAPHPGQAHSRADRPGGPVGRAQADFPVPLAEALAAAAAGELEGDRVPAAGGPALGPGQACALNAVVGDQPRGAAGRGEGRVPGRCRKGSRDHGVRRGNLGAAGWWEGEVVQALADSGVLWILAFAGLPVLYLLPTLVGAVRRVDGLALVFLVNLIGAPTGVGWLAAMILAFGPRRLPAPPPVYWPPGTY